MRPIKVICGVTKFLASVMVAFSRNPDESSHYRGEVHSFLFFFSFLESVRRRLDFWTLDFGGRRQFLMLVTEIDLEDFRVVMKLLFLFFFFWRNKSL